MAYNTTDEGSSKLPKCLVFQRKSLVGDFLKRTLCGIYRITWLKLKASKLASFREKLKWSPEVAAEYFLFCDKRALPLLRAGAILGWR